jgi:hypothetical protein
MKYYFTFLIIIAISYSAQEQNSGQNKRAINYVADENRAKQIVKNV